MTYPAYATQSQFRSFVRDTSTLDTPLIEQALLSASREVERICGRHFYQTTQTQYFSPRPNDPYWVDLDDMELATKTGLSVHVQWSNSIANPYPEVRTVDVDFVLQPVNQSMNGIDGWPYTQMQSLAKIWPQRWSDFYMDTVKVTGTFGWDEIPDPVVQATLMLAAAIYKSGEAPFGVAGFDNFGAVRVRGENPMVTALLHPYRKQTTLFVA